MTLTVKLRLFIMRLSVPFQKFLVRLGPGDRRGCAEWVRQIENNFMPGDILVSREKHHATNLTIPGWYSHAALIIDRHTVVEALPTGVQKTDIIDFVLKKDYVAHVRPAYASIPEREHACRVAEKICGKPYDFLFAYSPNAKKNKAFYCSEVPYFCYKGSMWAQIFKPKQILGMITIVPQDYRDAATGEKLDLINEF